MNRFSFARISLSSFFYSELGGEGTDYDLVLECFQLSISPLLVFEFLGEPFLDFILDPAIQTDIMTICAFFKRF